MSEQKQKPLIIEIEESKVELIQAINNIMQTHKLPCYIIDMILENVHSQIKEGAKGELKMAQTQTDEVEEG